MKNTRSQTVVPIVIPTYEPDRHFVDFVKSLIESGLSPIYIVNDGSGKKYDKIFAAAGKLAKKSGGEVLSYEMNHGKGYAIKTALRSVEANVPSAIGIITVDSDGQHSAASIKQVRDEFLKHQDSLILGVRDFFSKDVPAKSRFGNKLTIKIMQYVAGVSVSDTQTGLRAIPRRFFDTCEGIGYDRFELETEMLILAKDEVRIREVPIETIYDSKKHHKTHFRPFSDSIKIYAVLLKRFFKFIVSSFSSSIIDLALFTIVCGILKGQVGAYVAIATFAARIVSSIYNYIVNYYVVFGAKSSHGRSAVGYFMLAAAKMAVSAAVTTVLCFLAPLVPEVVFKVIVDTILFFINFKIQQKFVFSKDKK